MKVLVTGATGFIGSWLTRRLIDDGVHVCVLHRRSSSTIDPRLSAADVAIGDVTDLDSLASACKGIHTVFHLAGVVGYSPSQRPLMEEVNVEGTNKVIQAARLAKVSRLVHMSSVVAVGASFDGAVPLNENSTYNLNHLNLGYFETKRRAEQLVVQSAIRGDLEAVILNPSTVYGAGDAAKGSRSVQLKVAHGKFPFYTSGGVSVIAVEDVVRATIQAWRVGRSGERYILSGDNITIYDLFKTIAEFAGVRPPYIHLPNGALRVVGWAGDILEKFGQKGPLNSESAWAARLFHWFDNSKARNELGLNPKSAREAIKSSVDWILQQKKLV